jgi:hypothetical protein
MLLQAIYVLSKKNELQKKKKLIFISIKPVPINVIANETEERPLIKVSTANGARRPILKKHFHNIFFYHLTSNLLISNNKCNNK